MADQAMIERLKAQLKGKFSRDDSREVPIYTLEDEIDHEAGTCFDWQGQLRSCHLSGIIRLEIGFAIVYRATRIEYLENVLQTGSNNRDMKEGDSTYVTSDLEKSLEYGNSSDPRETRAKCVIIYDANAFKRTEHPYRHVFTRDPKEALKAILIIKYLKPHQDIAEQAAQHL